TLARHRPLRRIALAVADAGELQQCLVGRELGQEREPVARAEVGALGERRSVDGLVPRQRRMSQRGDQRAVPPELPRIDTRSGAGASGPSAHGHTIEGSSAAEISLPECRELPLLARGYPASRAASCWR